MSLAHMQRRVVEWHNAKFPGATNAAIALKTGEEAGELAKAEKIAHAEAKAERAR